MILKATVSAWIIAGMLLFTGCSQEPSSNAQTQTGPLLIEPHVRVGKVRSGMTAQQVVSELGQPQRKIGMALEYSGQGFAVIPDSNGMVTAVMCGDVTGINGPFVTAFKGQTKEGIGMRSTREDLVKAYGEPAVSQKFPRGLESLQYAALGLTFTLEAGKVHHLIVRFGSTVETNRTITLEPLAP